MLGRLLKNHLLQVLLRIFLIHLLYTIVVDKESIDDTQIPVCAVDDDATNILETIVKGEAGQVCTKL